MPPKRSAESGGAGGGAAGERGALDRPLVVGDSFLLRSHAGRQRGRGAAVTNSFVAAHPCWFKYEHVSPLAAVAPRAHAARFTVKSAEPLSGAAPEVQHAAAVAAARGANLDNARVVTLGFVGPYVGLYDFGFSYDGELLGNACDDGEMQPLVAVPLAGEDAAGTPLAQLFLMNATRHEGEFHWLGASEPPGRGLLMGAAPSQNAKAPSGWEAFDIIDFKAEEAKAAGDEAEKRGEAEAKRRA